MRRLKPKTRRGRAILGVVIRSAVAKRERERERERELLDPAPTSTAGSPYKTDPPTV